MPSRRWGRERAWMSVMWVKPMSEIPWVVAGLRASDIEAKLLSDKMPTTPVLVPGRLEVSAASGTGLVTNLIIFC